VRESLPVRLLYLSPQPCNQHPISLFQIFRHFLVFPQHCHLIFRFLNTHPSTNATPTRQPPPSPLPFLPSSLSSFFPTSFRSLLLSLYSLCTEQDDLFLTIRYDPLSRSLSERYDPFLLHFLPTSMCSFRDGPGFLIFFSLTLTYLLSLSCIDLMAFPSRDCLLFVVALFCGSRRA
jgi:hypothetical protein